MKHSYCLSVKCFPTTLVISYYFLKVSCYQNNRKSLSFLLLGMNRPPEPAALFSKHTFCFTFLNFINRQAHQMMVRVPEIDHGSVFSKWKDKKSDNIILSWRKALHERQVRLPGEQLSASAHEDDLQNGRIVTLECLKKMKCKKQTIISFLLYSHKKYKNISQLRE